MTPETIDKRITELKQELEQLKQTNKSVVEQFQKMVSQHQNRYAQLTGAITELNALKSANTEGNINNQKEHDSAKRNYRQAHARMK